MTSPHRKSVAVAIGKIAAIPASARRYLHRLQLDDPRDTKEMLMQRAVVCALTSVGAI